MRVIGVTGGVGAGKSTVLDYLKERYGADVIQADLVGHEVMEPGGAVCGAVAEAFGPGILTADGSVDRAALAKIVFGDEEKRRLLNGIVHPAVKEEILRRLSEDRERGVPCAVVEAALFLEENYDAFCDETWYIYTDEKNRRRRLRESRGYSDERISRMFASQMTHGQFLSRCRTVIDNNGSAGETFRQIDKRMRR
ncbi:MAG: dephospho-CoA kinase [Eubacteriales bacterium]|nr:dephospho-CoA kinase [Eubacteriales bacterium]